MAKEKWKFQGKTYGSKLEKQQAKYKAGKLGPKKQRKLLGVLASMEADKAKTEAAYDPADVDRQIDLAMGEGDAVEVAGDVEESRQRMGSGPFASISEAFRRQKERKKSRKSQRAAMRMGLITARQAAKQDKINRLQAMAANLAAGAATDATATTNTVVKGVADVSAEAVGGATGKA